MPRYPAALLAAAALAACGLPGATPARAFSLDFQQGQSFQYQLHITVSGNLTSSGGSLPVNSDQTVNETVRVQAVKPDGTATLSVDVAPAQGQKRSYQFDVGRDGKILAGGDDSVSSTTPTVPGSDQLTPLLPPGKVHPGDTWRGTYNRPNPFGAGALSFPYSGKYLRDEKLGAYSTSVIETRIHGPLVFDIDLAKLFTATGKTPPANLPADAKIHYTGSLDTTADYWLDSASKQVIKDTQRGTYSLTYDLTNLPPGQGIGTGKISFQGSIDSDLRKV